MYVTHDQSEAITMSTVSLFLTMVLFNNWQIRSLCTKSQKTRSWRRFIGENNQMVGTVASVSKGIATINLDSGAEVKALSVNISGT